MYYNYNYNYDVYRMMARYCFVEFSDALTAKSALYNLTSIVMPGSNAVSTRERGRGRDLIYDNIILFPSIAKEIQTQLGK